MYKTVNDRVFEFDSPKPIGPARWAYEAYGAISSFVWSVRYHLTRVSITNKKYYVSICAIFKNEARYLREWIEFHRIVGVDHFYLYNNNSEDDYESVLDPYINSGIVTLVSWPKQQAQMEAYRNCISSFSEETNWLGFIDIDEFVVPVDTNSIGDFLRPFQSSYGSVLIYWRLFGSSGQMDRNSGGLVVEDFVSSWERYCDIGKCFMNTAFELADNQSLNACLHHLLWTKKGRAARPPVNPYANPCAHRFNFAPVRKMPIQINHYFTKSYLEYCDKCSKGDVYFKENPHDVEYFFRHEMKCTSVDYSAYKYLLKLKLALSLNKN
ncbi:glycosyltransferase family 92 protein [Collinsella sp. LCP21S3_E4]|uniref:glycosyltransferase family 92 protein n=1 Tax=Collinsella sp. LCP21S3_E4 TaxID=3438774 RepID=UPI003F8EEBB9